MQVINTNIGSGIQEHRRVNAGHFNGVTPAVAIVNFEDAAAVESFSAQPIVVGTSTAVKLPTTNLIRRRGIAINNNGGAPIYIGGTSGVTIASGYPVKAGTEKFFEIAACLDIWAIASGTSTDIRVLEIA